MSRAAPQTGHQVGFFLQPFKKQRTDLINRQCQKGIIIEDDAIFDDEDMRLIHQAWMADIDSWMHPDDAELYRARMEAAPINAKGKGKCINKGKAKGQTKGKTDGKGQGGQGQSAYQMRRSAFSAYLFQILGNKNIVLAKIRSPCTCAAQLRHFITDWRKYKDTDEHKKAVRDSCPKTEKQAARK